MTLLEIHELKWIGDKKVGEATDAGRERRRLFEPSAQNPTPSEGRKKFGKDAVRYNQVFYF